MSRTATQELFTEELYRIPTSLLIVLPTSWHDILDEDKALLTKILGSIRINIGSVNIQTFQSITPDLITSLQPSRVITFGSKIEGMAVSSYEKVMIGDVPVIHADALNVLDDQKKKSLWIALKQMFSL